MSSRKSDGAKPRVPAKRVPKQRVKAPSASAAGEKGLHSGGTARTGAGSVLREAASNAFLATSRASPHFSRQTAPARTLPDTAPTVSLADQLATVAAGAASGNVRRKNMNMDQGLLDTVIAASGVTSETEAVRLGLAAYVEMATFEKAMLEGFDRWSSRSGFALESDAPIDIDAFVARSDKARDSSER